MKRMPRMIDQVHLTPRKKYKSNAPIDKDKNQDDCFQPWEMSELRQPYAPLGVVNETLDETIIIHEYGPEADHYSVQQGNSGGITLQAKTSPFQAGNAVSVVESK